MVAVNNSARVIVSRDTFESDTAAAGVREMGDASEAESVAAKKSTFNADTTALFPNKIENPLHQYNSFNSIFTLAVLTLDEINFPAKLRSRPASVTILRSGGSGSSKYLTLYDANFDGNTSAQRTAREYFINDVNINTMPAPHAKGSSNITKIDFTVYEPYSMGTFIETIKQAAKSAGFNNWVEAPYCLTIEFIGNKLNNQSEFVADSNGSSTKRVFPIKLTDINFTADQAGAQYQVQAIPVPDLALRKSVQLIQNDVTIQGSTVQQMLQESLQTELNKKNKKNSNSTNESVIHDVIINFPQQKAAEELAQKTGQNDGSATVDPNAQRSELVGSGGQVYRTPSQTAYTQPQDTVNDIGKSKVNITKDQYKKVMSEDTKEFYNTVTKNIKLITQGQTPNITFKSGTSLEVIVTNVILLSDYGRFLLQDSDQDGFKKWFKIVPRAYYIKDDDALEKTGAFPILYVLDVIEHKVHESLLVKPNKKTNTANINKFVIKEYNYLFSGSNLDVLKFDIDIKAGFQSQLPSDKADSKEDPNRKSKSSKENQSDLDQSVGDTAKESVASGKTVTNYFYNPRRSARESIGELTTEQKQTLEFHDFIQTGAISFTNTDLTILGDPYFLADSGTGNYYAQIQKDPVTGNPKFINKDGSAEPTFNGIYIVVNFRTPIDYAANGQTVFKDTASQLNKNFVKLDAFSGVFRVTDINNNFSNGVFTQNIKLVRVANQEVVAAVTADSVINKKLIADVQATDQQQQAFGPG